MTASREIERLREHLVDEWNGAALYEAIAATERDPRLAEIYRRFAVVERRHADNWRRRLESAGAEVPPNRISWRTRTLIWLARRFGTSVVLPSIQSIERQASHKYAGVPGAAGIDAEERSHARVLGMMQNVPGGFEGNQVARLEGRHRSTGGNALRAAVLGANDGLVSNLSLVMAVAGADLAPQTIVITGLAGLLAGAGSMAMGEWLSVQSARELYAHQIETEEAELLAAPVEEEEELALIYESRGMDRTSAQQMASQMMSSHQSALEALTREELGIDPQELGGSAWQAAFTSFLLFAIGALFPVVPFFFASGFTAVLWSIVVSAAALFALGGAITLFTARPLFRSGARQVVFGLTAAALTFGVGRLLGVTLS